MANNDNVPGVVDSRIDFIDMFPESATTVSGPATMTLVGLGLAGLGLAARRRRV